MERKYGKKRVWFSEGSNIIHKLQYNEDKDNSLRWYSRQDLIRFSSEMRHSTLNLLSKQQGLEDRDREKIAFNNVLSRIFSACRAERLPTESDFQRYMSWNKASPDLRGIERYCAEDLTNVLKKHKAKITNDLLLSQERLRKEGVAREISSQFIRFAYRKEVKAYRILARIQGIVDASLTLQYREDMCNQRKYPPVVINEVESSSLENITNQCGCTHNKKPRFAKHSI
jgi:hypothetical protein